MKREDVAMSTKGDPPGFFEEDEPIDKIIAAYENSERGMTVAPDSPSHRDRSSAWTSGPRTKLVVEPSRFIAFERSSTLCGNRPSVSLRHTASQGALARVNAR